MAFRIDPGQSTCLFHKEGKRLRWFVPVHNARFGSRIYASPDAQLLSCFSVQGLRPQQASGRHAELLRSSVLRCSHLKPSCGKFHSLVWTSLLKPKAKRALFNFGTFVLLNRPGCFPLHKSREEVRNLSPLFYTTRPTCLGTLRTSPTRPSRHYVADHLWAVTCRLSISGISSWKYDGSMKNRCAMSDATLSLLVAPDGSGAYPYVRRSYWLLTHWCSVLDHRGYHRP